MALTKVTYVNKQTVIDAAQLNAIQDEIIRVSADKSMGLSGLAADDQIMVSAVDTDGKPSSLRKSIGRCSTSRTSGPRVTATRTIQRPFRRQSTGLCKQDTAYAPEEYAAAWEVVE